MRHISVHQNSKYWNLILKIKIHLTVLQVVSNSRLVSCVQQLAGKNSRRLLDVKGSILSFWLISQCALWWYRAGDTCVCVCVCVCHVVYTAKRQFCAHVTRTYHTVPYRIISYHIVSYRTISYHIVPRTSISYHTVPYRTIYYYIVSHRTMSIISYHVGPYSTISYIVPYRTSYRTISYHIVSYSTISYHIAPYSTIWYHTVSYRTI